MKYSKITCPTCKKNIYTKRESEYVTCTECGSISSIIKEIPNRPTTIYHHFNQSIVIPEKNDFYNDRQINKIPNPIINKNNNKNINKNNHKNNIFNDLINTVRSNEISIIHQTNLYKKK